VEKGKVNLKKFFKLKGPLESEILSNFYIQNTSCITTKGRNVQTYSDIEIIQKLRYDPNFLQIVFLKGGIYA
jgi:hypothetical protein